MSDPKSNDPRKSHDPHRERPSGHLQTGCKRKSSKHSARVKRLQRSTTAYVKEETEEVLEEGVDVVEEREDQEAEVEEGYGVLGEEIFAGVEEEGVFQKEMYIGKNVKKVIRYEEKEEDKEDEEEVEGQDGERYRLLENERLTGAGAMQAIEGRILEMFIEENLEEVKSHEEEEEVDEEGQVEERYRILEDERVAGVAGVGGGGGGGGGGVSESKMFIGDNSKQIDMYEKEEVEKRCRILEDKKLAEVTGVGGFSENEMFIGENLKQVEMREEAEEDVEQEGQVEERYRILENERLEVLAGIGGRVLENEMFIEDNSKQDEVCEEEEEEVEEEPDEERYRILEDERLEGIAGIRGGALENEMSTEDNLKQVEMYEKEEDEEKEEEVEGQSREIYRLLECEILGGVEGVGGVLENEILIGRSAEQEVEGHYGGDQEDEYDLGGALECNPSCSTRENSFLMHLRRPDYNMVGGRICHMGYVLKETLRKAATENKHRPGCVSGTFNYLDYHNKGLATIVNLQCDECQEIISIHSHPNDPEVLDTNRSAVLGCMAAGIGFSTLEQVLAAMGVPCMSSKTFRHHQEEIVLEALGISKECMRKSREKEIEIAIKKGNIIKGVPYITVITDASWAKRSFGRAYNSLGGCAVIIGYETGEVIDVVIRCKACSMCDRANREGREPKTHYCYKNYDRNASSGGMESDAILEAFNNSLKKEKPVIYRYLIADGDSSVLKTLLIHDPYREYGVRVKKIECTNHLLRNFVKKLEDIANTRGENEISGDGCLDARRCLLGRVLPLRFEVQAAVERKNEDTRLPIEDSISLLIKDIWNVPSHVFGEHKGCSELGWPCAQNPIDEYETNYVPLLVSTGIYSKIMKVVKDLSATAESLLYNVTTNPAESYNSIICKTISGKRINFAMRESYTGRCLLAVLQYNTKRALSSMFEGLQKTVPEEVIKMESQRILQQERRKKCSNKYTRVSQNKNTDKNYGPTAEKPDLPQELYQTFLKEHFENLLGNQQKRHEIFHSTTLQADSGEWGSLREIMLTASNYGKVCLKRETTCAGLVKALLYTQAPTRGKGREAIQYGKDNEVIARQELSAKLNTEIKPSGLIIDHAPHIPYLGASPDGIIDAHLKDLENINPNMIMNIKCTEYFYEVIAGGVVEIKCPKNAEYHTIEEAIEKHAYLKAAFDASNPNFLNKRHSHYFQIQGQLHHGERSYGVFVMWSPKSMKIVVVMRDDNFWQTQMEPKLTAFYLDCLLPEMLDGRYKRNMDIREPDYVLKAKEAAETRKLEAVKKTQLRKEAKQRGAHENEEYDTESRNTVDDLNFEHDMECLSTADDVNEKYHKECQNTVDHENGVHDTECQNTAYQHEEERKTIAQEGVGSKRKNEWVRQAADIANLVPPSEEERQELDSIYVEIPVENLKDIILNKNEFLDDVCLDKFIYVLRRHSIFDVLSVQCLINPRFVTPSLQGQQDIQIVGGNTSAHYRCYYFDKIFLHILDSKGPKNYTQLTEEEKNYIKLRYPNLRAGQVVSGTVTQQPDNTSCGIYAAAFATHLILGQNPYKIKFSRSSKKMREHFLRIIETDELTQFPTLK